MNFMLYTELFEFFLGIETYNHLYDLIIQNLQVNSELID